MTPDDLRADVVARIQERLDAMLPRPYTRLRMTSSQVIGCIRAVAEGRPYGFASADPGPRGWPEPWETGWPGPWTTVALAARVGGRVHLGIKAVADLFGGADSQDSAWPALRPWKAVSDEIAWSNWARGESVMALEASEVDLLMGGTER